jgi:hypothetical protein
MMRTLVALALVAFVGCGGVNKKDADDLLAGLITISDAPADLRPMLLTTMCSEIPSCSEGKCNEAFKTLPTVAEQDRLMLVVQCAPEMRDPAVKKLHDPFAMWIRAYVDRYVQKARASLAEADRAKLDSAWEKAHSTN